MPPLASRDTTSPHSCSSSPPPTPNLMSAPSPLSQAFLPMHTCTASCLPAHSVPISAPSSIPGTTLTHTTSPWCSPVTCPCLLPPLPGIPPCMHYTNAQLAACLPVLGVPQWPVHVSSLLYQLLGCIAMPIRHSLMKTRPVK